MDEIIINKKELTLKKKSRRDEIIIGKITDTQNRKILKG
jgi:hypothetical protein